MHELVPDYPVTVPVISRVYVPTFRLSVEYTVIDGVADKNVINDVSYDPDGERLRV